MKTSATASRERTILFVSMPALWPHWPFLPVVRRTRGVEELGVVFDARAFRDLLGRDARDLERIGRRVVEGMRFVLGCHADNSKQ